MSPASNPIAERIEQLLQQRLKPAHLEVRDDSAAHAGHASAGGRGHFHLKIVSTCFEGLKPLQRHRLVNQTLAALFETDVHALGLETLTPAEFKK
ncbi:MAG TPA: BolA family protein [Steroidobacteraceae bacterium]|jgi:BolA protein|nr:BolA family protein [Steroidobacteraceae bacterium]